ncbi:MAG: SDR family oxidoreductase [Cyanobacteria bacterium P01_H01_bin.153]
MRSLLITGASGLLGGHLCRQEKAGWQRWGTYHQQTVTTPQAKTLPLDLTAAESIQAVWEQVRPDAVIHTAALSQVGICQRQPDYSYQVNVAGTLALAQRCAQAQIPFIFTSTDLVFDGTAPPYSEGDRPCPINVYGEHKALAEAQILACYPAATICRLPLLVGAATPTAQSFVQPLLRAIAANTSQTLFTDEIRTPAAVNDVVQGLDLILEKAVTGIWHLGGCQRFNRYELGVLIAESFSVPITSLQPGLQASINLATPRPKDVSLNSQKAFDLGYAPQPLATALAAIAQVS